MQDFVPIGLLSLAAAAQQADIGADIRVIEVNGLINAGAIKNDLRFYDRVADLALEAGDNLVGLMTDADSLQHSMLLAQEIKRKSPSTVVCLGGPGAAAASLRLMGCFRCIDVIARGEAELTFVELLGALQHGRNFEGIPGLTWRDGDRLIDNGARPLVESADDLPVPAFDIYDMSIGAPLYLDVGRGCPYKCTFCATAPYWERRFRMKSIERILEEMYLVRDRYGRSHVNFSHDVFTANQPWVERFCQHVIEARPGMTWTCSTRTDVIDSSLLEKMSAAGCVEIYYGIESGSASIQRQIDKGLDLDNALDVVRATRAAGIRPVTGFIVGYPTETMETLSETVARFFQFLDAGGFRAHIFTLCPFGGSPLHQRYALTTDRRAEYCDLPLVPMLEIRAEELKGKFDDIFCSAYRYAVPGVPSPLVDASEELSPHLVVLKAVWPLLLPYYPSALDWYQHWVVWIGARNTQRGSDHLLAHQGDTRDVLDFLDDELARLNLVDSDVGDVVRYERAKLAARTLTVASASDGTVPSDLGDGTVVAKRGDFLLIPFQHDLKALLRGKPEVGPYEPNERWVVFMRTSEDAVSTIGIGPLGKALLEALERPTTIGDLVKSVATASDEAADPPVAVQLVRQFIRCGLIGAEGAPQ
jgi:radical SAM superfamily enzyme YgiQ (UPF0313 family)